MANFHILTNNPAVAAAYGAIAQPLTGGVAAVFIAARDAVHLGAELISHPLAGSLKPNENPYKSIVLSAQKGALNAKSLALIEDAIAVLKKLPAKARSYPPPVLEDFSVIDLDLVHSAMQALPAQYHQHPHQKHSTEQEAHHGNDL